MKKSQQHMAVVGAVAIGVALLLSSNPNCNKGCRTIAQHLLDHGFDDLLAGLFA
jgi:hypothetical protein